MARERVFKVVIDGEEYVSKAADEAGKGMDKFTGKKDGWIRSFVDLRAAFDTVVQVGRALAGVALDSLAAFDEYDASMRKLEGTAKITGTPLAELSSLAAHAKREFGLSSVQANDYATAVNNLASKAGYAGDKQELLARMLDLGAAKGLTAAESLVAFEQSILGIDEGTDKLFGKNPSGLWADYAEQIGKSPGKMSDLEKSLVLVYATMEAGGMVQGSYSEWLKSSAGQTALLTNRLQDAKVSFGEILSPIRAVVVEGMNTFLDSMQGGEDSLTRIKGALTLVAQNLMGSFLTAWETLGPAVTFALKAAVAAVMLFSDAIQMMQIVTQEAVGWIAQKIGGLAEKSASVMRALGIEVKAEWGTALRTWGEGLDEKASATYTKFRETSTAAWAAATGAAEQSVRRTKDGFDEVEEAAKTTARATTRATVESTQDREKAEKDYAAFVKRAYQENAQEIKALNDLWKLKTEAVKSFEAAAERALQKDKLSEFKVGMQDITAASDAAFRKLMQQAEPLDQNLIKQRKIEQVVEQTVDVLRDNVRGVLDLAQAFGVVDAQAASVLTSVVNIAQAIPKALGGDLSSIGGILGAVGNIAKQIVGGDEQRQRLLRQNSEALSRLSRDIGGLKLNVTGEDFLKAQSALQGVVGQLRGGRGAANERDVRNALLGVGLTMSDLEKIGKEFGIAIRTESGALNVESITQLLQAMGMSNIGQVGQNFGDQLEFFRQSQDLTGNAGTPAGLQALLDFLVNAGGVSALQGFDLSAPGAATRLFELFTSLNNGGVSAGALGKLTGSQFRDLLVELIEGIGGLVPTAGSAPPASTPTVEGGETVPTSGAPTPATTLADVFRDYGAASLPLLTQQVDLQTRIAAATEATAANTALTADEVRLLRIAITSGSFLAGIDEGLARRRDLTSLAQGGGVVL